MSKCLYVMRFNASQGFSVEKYPLHQHPKNYRYFYYVGDSKRMFTMGSDESCHRISDFNYVVYFTDKAKYPQMKAKINSMIEEDLLARDMKTMEISHLYQKFLESKLGETL